MLWCASVVMSTTTESPGNLNSVVHYCDMLKRATARALQAIAGIALVVFLFVPIDTADRILLCLIAVIVGVGCLIVSGELDDGGSEHYTLWPPNKKSEGVRERSRINRV
jgi:hypothetical protein